jgi:hypothetical protein
VTSEHRLLISEVPDKIANEDLVAKVENGQIVETAKEARGAERGPTVRNVLVWSLALVVVAFAVVYFLFFKT